MLISTIESLLLYNSNRVIVDIVSILSLYYNIITLSTDNTL